MPIKYITKICAVIFCSMIFVSINFAQEKPKWVVFYNFELKEINNPDIVKKKLTEFLIRLSQEPKTTRGFIDAPGNTKLAQEMKSFIAANSKLEKRIVFSYNTTVPERPLGSFGFIIIPEGTEIPYPNAHDPVICPYIEVSAITKKVGRNTFVTFIADPKIEDIPHPKLKGLYNLIYQWKISAGEIIKGQGTRKLTVAVENAEEITGTVGLGGNQSECERDFSATVKIQK